MDDSIRARIGHGYEPRAQYATDPADSRGRRLSEPKSATRSEFQRDRDRIIHSTAFRRLKHKTQVFFATASDHYRTRLTHTIEVAQIARAIARALRLDEELTEAIALAHDLGHTPFGHTGEDALGKLMAPFGGFDHNDQALRVVTKLERGYANFDGLNLSWETLEGLAKHNGPFKNKLPATLHEINTEWPLALNQHATLEAQVAALADDIAYNAHDVDDGLRSGLLSLSALEDVPLLDQLLDQVRTRHPDLDEMHTSFELVRRQITLMVEDVITNGLNQIDLYHPQSAQDVRACERPLIRFTAGLEAEVKHLKSFLMDRMYRHSSVVQLRERATIIVAELFEAFLHNPAVLPESWQADIGTNENQKARIVCDFLAGMTDQYALTTYEKLIGPAPDLSFHKP